MRVTVDSLKWYPPDRDFTPVEPPAWVYEGVQKVFLSDLGNPKTLAYIDELAALGVTVVHTGGPAPYFPLRRDGGAGPDAKELAVMRAAFDRMHAAACGSSSASRPTRRSSSSASTRTGG